MTACVLHANQSMIYTSDATAPRTDWYPAIRTALGPTMSSRPSFINHYHPHTRHHVNENLHFPKRRNGHSMNDHVAAALAGLAGTGHVMGYNAVAELRLIALLCRALLVRTQNIFNGNWQIYLIYMIDHLLIRPCQSPLTCSTKYSRHDLHAHIAM